MTFKNNYDDRQEILKQLANQDVIIEFIPYSPTSIAEGFFAKGKLNSRDQENTKNAISIRLKINDSEIKVPFEDIKSIRPL